MRYLLLLAFAIPAFAADNQSCLIVKHASTAHQFFISGANWQYVAGDFPKGTKWKSNIRDRDVRKIKDMGGKVVVVASDYSAANLEDARKQCLATPEQGELKK